MLTQKANPLWKNLAAFMKIKMRKSKIGGNQNRYKDFGLFPNKVIVG
jgi:hypothetical protein